MNASVTRRRQDQPQASNPRHPSILPMRSHAIYFASKEHKKARTCYPLSQSSLPRQFNLPCRLPSLKPTPGHTHGAPLAQLNLLFHIRVCTRAVVRERNACKSSRTEVFIALCCKPYCQQQFQIDLSGSPQAKCTHLRSTSAGTGYCHWERSENPGGGGCFHRRTCARRTGIGLGRQWPG